MQTSQQILVGIIALVILIVLIVYTEYYSRRKFTKDKGEKFDEDLSPSYGSTSVDIEFKDKKVIHRHEEKVDEGQDEIELCNNETGFYAGSILYKTDVDLVRYNIKFVFSESGIVYRSIVEEYNYNASNLLIEMIAVSETINIPALALNKINDINYGTVEKIDQNCYYIKINVDKTVSGIQSTQRYQSVLIEKGRLIVSDIPEDSLNYPKPRHLNSFVFNYYCDFREFQVVNNQLQEFREILDALFKKEIQEQCLKFQYG